MTLVNGGFLHYTDMKKFLKNFVLRNHRSDFKIISQESGFDISTRPDSGRNCYRQAALTICEPAGQVKFLVCFCQFGSLLQRLVVLRSEKQMDIKLFTEFLFKKNDPSKNMAFMEDSFSSYGTK